MAILIFHLGFQPGGDPAFCGILGTVTVNSTETKRIVYPIIIGYEVWNYLAFLVLPVLYVSVRCKIRMAAKLERKVSSSECYTSLTCTPRYTVSDLRLVKLNIFNMHFLPKRKFVRLAVYGSKYWPCWGFLPSSTTFIHGIHALWYYTQIRLFFSGLECHYIQYKNL